MGNDFGKQFTDARYDRGVTLEEASEATKIRVEYLACIEDGNYSFGLPDIYVRGFIKIYAKYLNLDVDLVMDSCPVRDFNVADSRCGRRISYGAIVANEREQAETTNAGVDDTVPFTTTIGEMCGGVKRFFSNTRSRVIVGISVAMIVFVSVVAVTYKVAHTKNGHGSIPQAQVERALAESTQSAVSLISSGDVKVVVREKSSGERIFAGTLESGNVKKISYSKPIQIFYDGGEFLLIKQANGEQLYPQPGRGGVEIK